MTLAVTHSEPGPEPCWNAPCEPGAMCEFAQAASAGWLKQQKSITSQFQRPEVQSRGNPLGGVRARSLPHSWVGLQGHPSNMWGEAHTAPWGAASALDNGCSCRMTGRVVH